MVAPVRRLPVAAIALLALAALGAAEWPWANGFSMHGAVCNVADQCNSPEAHNWRTGTRCAAAAVVALWIGSALPRTWARGAGTGPIRSDMSLRVAIPLAAAGLVVAAGWFGLGTALLAALVGSTVGGITMLGATLIGLVRVVERVVDTTWGHARPNLAAQLAWLTVLTGTLSAVVAASTGGVRVATWSAAVTVAVVTVTCDALARRGLRTLAVPLAVVTSTLLVVLAAIGYLTALMSTFLHEAFKPVERPPAVSAPGALAPEATMSPRAATPPTPLNTGVPADRACRPQDLTLTGGGWDFTMGKGSMTITAHNTSTAACQLDGIPHIRIAQGGKDLDLTYEPGSAENIGQPGTPRRVGVPADGTAQVVLWWPGYRNAADQKTPQRLYAAVVPGREVDVPLNPPPGGGPAHFDLVDGGRVVVSAWAVAP